MGGLGVFVVRVNPRECRRSNISESVDGESELFMLAVNTDCRRSVIIAQREPGSDLEVFPAAGGDSGNPREFWEKRSGESGNIHPVSWQCRPHTVSGSRTARTGGHKLEKVCDLRFFVVRRRGGLRTDSEGSCGAKSPFLEVHRVVAAVAAVSIDQTRSRATGDRCQPRI